VEVWEGGGVAGLGNVGLGRPIRDELSSPAPMAAVDGVWAREGARGSFYRRHGFEMKQTRTQGRSIWGQVGRRQSTASGDAVWAA